MRIISGKNKGRQIITPKNLPVRPTTDFAKESLFNILNNLVALPEMDVLDLFAGTGNISYEFASRDCKTITAVDINRSCIKFIRQTATNLDFVKLFVFQEDYRSFINNANNKWDIIYADPPYSMAGIGNIPQLIFENQLLNHEGFLILEHDKNLDFKEHIKFFDHRHYGKVNFTFFMNQ